MIRKHSILISIILPCRNEENSISECLNIVKKIIRVNQLNAEIIVSDSSSDNSPDIAKRHGVRLHRHKKNGYGNALLEGTSRAKGDYIFFADADGTYDFKEIPRFIKYLDEGYDIVIGNRLGKNKIQNMPWLHKYIGTPLLSFLFRIFFNSEVKDVNSGMRAIKKDKFEDLKLKTPGMEFASEMIIRASEKKLKIKEVNIVYKPRSGESKLRTFRDGWRHLRLILLNAPLFLFFLPGMFLFLSGVFSMAWMYFQTKVAFQDFFLIFLLISFTLVIIAGYQLMLFTIFARTYSMTNLDKHDMLLQKFYKTFTLEKGVAMGTLFITFGIFLFIFSAIELMSNPEGIKNALISSTIIILGIQTIFSSFMLSILSIKNS